MVEHRDYLFFVLVVGIVSTTLIFLFLSINSASQQCNKLEKIGYDVEFTGTNCFINIQEEKVVVSYDLYQSILADNAVIVQK